MEGGRGSCKDCIFDFVEHRYALQPARQHAAAQVVELTREGVAFLQQRFSDFDRDRDGRLSRSEQDDMFSCAPSRWFHSHVPDIWPLLPRLPRCLWACGYLS